MYMQIDPAQAWEKLRASRANRPGRATGGARAKTYSTALEQAQQMFRAAEVVGPQTRSLLVFYGLSQAGRAIAAAAVDLKDHRWNLISHGIHASGFDKTFAEIELRTDPPGGAGSFVRLSELLESPVWGKDTVVQLGEVWDSLPLDLPHPLSKGDRKPPLYASTLSISDTPHPLLTVDVGEFPDRVVDAGSRIALEEFLASYPGTVGYEAYVRAVLGSDAPGFERKLPDAGWLTMHWQMPSVATATERIQRLDIMTRSYAGHKYFFPALNGLSGELHPLMAWWAVLYTLSMLTRYQPAQWAAHIDIDASRHAILVEKLLVLAMEHLPVLIADTIDEVATWPPDPADNQEPT
jgi:hypothetical protein